MVCDRKMSCGMPGEVCQGVLSLKEVSSLVDFEHHVAHHRQRVLQLGKFLADSYFPQVSGELLSSFLSLHDFSKTMIPSEVLERVGWLSSSQPFENLYNYFGKATGPLETEVEFKSLLQSLNEIDNLIAHDFFSQKINLESSEISLICKIERVADLVDRYMDPLATIEFGRPMQPASLYLDDLELVGFAKFLELHYFEVINLGSLNSIILS